MSRKEKTSGVAMVSNWDPDIVPFAASLKLLATYGIRNEEAETFVRSMHHPMSIYKLMTGIAEKGLARNEKIQQAEATARVAKELQERLVHMDPDLRSRAIDMLPSGVDGHPFAASLDRQLSLFALAMDEIASELEAKPVKVRARTGPRDELLASLIESLRKHVVNLRPGKRLEIARVLAESWGVPVPASDNKVRKVVNKTK